MKTRLASVMTILCSLLALVMSGRSFASRGGQDSGGGDIFLCHTSGGGQSVYLADVYPLLGNKNLEFLLLLRSRELVTKSALEALAQMAPSEAKIIQEAMDGFQYVVDENLPELDDDGIDEAPPLCSKHQLAIQDRNSGVIAVKESYRQRLSILEQGLFPIHEAYIKIKADLAKADGNTSKVRAAVLGIASSSSFSDYFRKVFAPVVESNFTRLGYIPGNIQSPNDPGSYTPYEFDLHKSNVHARSRVTVRTVVSEDTVIIGSEELYGYATTNDNKAWIDSFQDIPDQQIVYGREGEAQLAGVICVSESRKGSPGLPFSPFAGFVAVKAKAKVRLQRSVIGIGGLPGVYKWWEVRGRLDDDYEMKLVLNGRCPYVNGNINNVLSEVFAKMSLDDIAEFAKQLPTQLEEFRQRSKYK